MAIVLPFPQIYQPDKNADLDFSHPALDGVTSAIILFGDVDGWRSNHANGDLGSLIGDPTFNGTTSSDMTEADDALKFDGSSTYINMGAVNITDEFTAMWGGVFNALAGVTGIVDCSDNGTSGWSIFTGNTDLYLSGNRYAGDLLSSGWVAGRFYHGAARNKAGVGKSIFRDGAKIADSASGLAGVSNPINPFWIGQLRVSSPRFLSASLSYFYLVNKYLDDETISDIAVNSNGIFAPQRKPIGMGASAASIVSPMPVFINHYRNQGIL